MIDFCWHSFLPRKVTQVERQVWGYLSDMQLYRYTPNQPKFASAMKDQAVNEQPPLHHKPVTPVTTLAGPNQLHVAATVRHPAPGSPWPVGWRTLGRGPRLAPWNVV